MISDLAQMSVGGFAFLSVVAQCFSVYFVAKLNTKQAAAAIAVAAVKSQAADAAVMVQEVKTNLADTNFIANEKLNNIHTLVNSSMGLQLKMTAAALRRLALLTKDPEDEKAAQMAIELSKEHEAKQAEVDAGNDKK